MKTTYALLDENSSPIFKTSDIKELERIKNEVEKRRTGKTTRAIFEALASDKDVVIIVQKLHIAKHIHVPLLEKLLVSAGMHFQYNRGYQEFQVYGRKIYFRTQEQIDSCPYLNITGIFERIYDDK